MKKNLFNGLLVLAVASVGVGTFSSCKDDNGDELSVVQSKLSALELELNNLKDCKKHCEAKWNELNIRINELSEKEQNDYFNLSADIQGLKDRIKELEDLLSRYNEIDIDKINEFMEIHSLATNELIIEIQNDINNLINNSVDKSTFNELQNIVNNIQNDINIKYTELNEKAEEGVKAWAWIQQNKNRLDALEQADEEIKAKHEADIINLQNQINDITNKLNLQDVRIGDLESKVGTLEQNFIDLQDRVAANEAAIQQLKEDVNKLFGLADRLNKLVTGIINQATSNPVFGSFNIPMNVRSNMLITYFGSAENLYTFPSLSSAAEYNGEQVITAADIQMLEASGNFKSLSIEPGDVLMDTEDGNAGMVFLTINPNNVDFTGMNLPLVDSQDNESGIKLKNLKKSDKVLHFGFTRAADNGFYEAQATLAPENVNDVAVKIEPGLKSAFKDALQNRGKKDFAQLAKILYNQFSDILPANGLKASWTAPDGNGNMKDYAVYSNYDIAATAVSPLSFKFMEGESIDHKLPIITPISEFEFDKDKFTFDFDVPEIDIKDPNFDIQLHNIYIDRFGEVIIEIQIPKVDDSGNIVGFETVQYDIKDDVNKIIGQIEESLNNKLVPEWDADIEDAFRKAFEKLRADVESQIKDAFDDAMGQIDENIKDMIDEINKEVDDALGGFIDKANKVIDKYNKLADKLNKFLDNPNHLLQSMACYKGTDGDFHQLSNSKDMPSPFRLAGGNAITIYLTTYNAEIVAPSFRKFVGVTNVWNNATGADAHADGTCKQLLIEANSQEFMNHPITGKQKRIAFAADKAGYTYEIVYSALDYRGWTSTRKYYVTVE